MELELLKLQLILLMMYLSQRLMPTEIKKSMLELKDKPSGLTSYRELTLLVMPFKTDKETHWLTHGLSHSLLLKITTLLTITNILLS